MEFQQENPELAAILNNTEEAGSEAYQIAMQAYTDKVQEKMGSEASTAYLYDDAQMAEAEKTGTNGVSKDGYGMADMETGDVYVNIRQTDMSDTEELVAVLGHENVHGAGDRSEAVAKRGETQAQNAWSRENAYNGNRTGGGYESGGDFYESQQESAPVRKGSGKVAGVEDVGAMNEERLLRLAWSRDFKKTPEQSADEFNQEMIQPVVKGIENGIEKAGDTVQAIPDPVLSGAGFVAGGLAVVGTSGAAVLATGVGYLVMGASLTKATLDYAEDEKGAIETAANIGLEIGGNLPVAGNLIDGGVFLYDMVKYNYEEGYRIDLNSDKED